MKKSKEGMRYEVHYRPGFGKDGRDYLAVTPDCVGGIAFGKTEAGAIRALKRIYSMKTKK